MRPRRKTLHEAADYERMRPTALTVLDKAEKTDLTIARNFATSQSIWSAKALNDLLKALRAPGRRLNAGPNIPLDEERLKHIHLTDGSVRGNPGLLTNGGELEWPIPLRAGKFDEARTKFKQKFRSAIEQFSKDKEPVDQPTLNDLRTNLKTLNETLAANSEDMSPSQYIEARRFLNPIQERTLFFRLKTHLLRVQGHQTGTKRTPSHGKPKRWHVRTSRGSGRARILGMQPWKGRRCLSA